MPSIINIFFFLDSEAGEALVKVINETEQVSEAVNLALRKTITETENITEAVNLALRKTIT